MNEITPPASTRGWRGQRCEVWVDGEHVRIRLNDDIHLSDVTPEQLEQLAWDLSSASNHVKKAVVEFKRTAVAP